MQSIERSDLFEIHLTANLTTAELDSFIQFCHLQNWKPLHIVLARGAMTSQPMATIHGKGAESDAVSLMKQSAAIFSRHGFRLVRSKIEFDIGAPLVPEVLPRDAIQRGCYFEHHLKLRLLASGPTAALLDLARWHDAHWSRNALKQLSDGYEHRFLTIRHFNETKQVSLAKNDALVADLTSNGCEIVKCESEYCVYDSQCDLDAGWIAGEAGHV